ncbi:MAG: hypothetical protein H6744_20935 [Deltaproteobacteria bacterium]|nr:hypothetical protein [Deltaproteobacteria bacterium]
MGEVIRSRSDRADIVADARKTLEAARLRGADFAGPAEERLAPTLEIYKGIASELETKREALMPLRIAVDKANADSDDVITIEIEGLYNLAGRRRNDPWLATLAPGGASAYVDGSTAEQPVRMTLFANLLRKIGHRQIDKAETDAAADRIEAAAKPLAEALQALAGPAAEVALLDRVTTALARTLQMELVNLKRLWKAQGASEADIHSMIPDRPSATSRPAPQPTAA